MGLPADDQFVTLAIPAGEVAALMRALELVPGVFVDHPAVVSLWCALKESNGLITSSV